MESPVRPRLSVFRGLSARLLILTVCFVMLAEVLIFVPSIARFRMSYLDQKLSSVHLVLLSTQNMPESAASDMIEEELLSHIGAYNIAMRRPQDGLKMTLMFETPRQIDATVDLTQESVAESIFASFATLFSSGDRTLRVIGHSPLDKQVFVELVMDEAPLHAAMVGFGYRILALSLMISAITASLLFLALHLVLVRPLRRIANSMTAFSENPEDPRSVIEPSSRGDEIGWAERQLHDMQEAVRAALRQKTRLAALGTAVSKINHDLRNILSTASLLSDRLATIEDPEVRRITPRLVTTIDRAVKLCTNSLNFTREGAPVLQLAAFRLDDLVDELREALTAVSKEDWCCTSEVPGDLFVEADREQLFRVLVNLGRNALEAGATELIIASDENGERLYIDFRDNGPGLPPRARQNLFKPFVGSARSGGSGLGLAIAQELMRSHGGDLQLLSSDSEGTCFRLILRRGEPQQGRRAAE